VGFSEATKLKVKRKAAFRCCRCHEVGIEVHHIVPESEKGPNTLANAAPLCPSCHDRFGDNPKKRKEITQMRDFWYEVVREKYPTGPETSRLNDLVVEAQRGVTTQGELIAELERRVEEFAERLEQADDNTSAAEVAEITEGLVTAQRLGDKLYANVECRRCGTRVGLMSGRDACPSCGAPIG
jgi:hypothetical protein